MLSWDEIYGDPSSAEAVSIAPVSGPDGDKGQRAHDPDLANLLDEISAFITRFVAFPTGHDLAAVTLWAAHAHVVGTFDSTPRLALLSPEPGSGKTRTLEILDLLVLRPMHALSASPAAVFRSIEARRPTLLFDEVDAIWNRRGDDGSEDLRAMLNAGHRRGAAIPRCVGPTHEVVDFPVFAAVALAGLGDLPDTIMSRSVVIRMRRRLNTETVEPYRARLHEPQGHILRDRLAAWAEMIDGQLPYPDMPDGVTDRPADVWEPLLQVADAAEGDWPSRARAACVAIVESGTARAASLGIRLLRDLKTVFSHEDKLSTKTILDRLCGLEESPWGNLGGRELDDRKLASLLGEYGITSTKIRTGESTARGYRVEDLYDSWQRYVAAPTGDEAEHAEHPEQP
jgi:hypothetical protein